MFEIFQQLLKDKSHIEYMVTTTSSSSPPSPSSGHEVRKINGILQPHDCISSLLNIHLDSSFR
jgi:hypothetical protein